MLCITNTYWQYCCSIGGGIVNTFEKSICRGIANTPQAKESILSTKTFFFIILVLMVCHRLLQCLFLSKKNIHTTLCTCRGSKQVRL